MIPESEFSSTSALTLRLLWNRARGEFARPLPLVVLLGPAGSGKSQALRTVSQDLADGVVHASFDFEAPGPDAGVVAPATTVEVLARLADALSRGWRARRAAQFTRFTLGVLAVQAQLSGLPREQAKEELRRSVDWFASRPRVERVADRVHVLADSARNAGIFDDAVAETVKAVLPSLIRTIGRRPLGRAKRWHSDIPRAEGASPLDALVSLNRLANQHLADMTEWLTSAFLADVMENHPRMAAPDEGSPCKCNDAKKRPHWHNWVLLLDNIERPGGAAFLDDLRTAQERHLRQRPGDPDPLLIIATSGRWNPAWESRWCPPWLTEAARQGRSRAVPRCGRASYEHWLGGSMPEHLPTQAYPVLLESLDIERTAQVLGFNKHTQEVDLVQRATGGLAVAVHAAKAVLAVPPGARDPIRPGARDVLWPFDPTVDETAAWRDRLTQARLAQHLQDLGLDDFIASAPFATAPWLVPADTAGLAPRPQVGRILTELRAALWVTAPVHSGPTPDCAELHPWIGRTLVTALARLHDGAPSSYTDQFESLLGDPHTRTDPVRTAFCQLALGRVSEVVTYFTECFDGLPHQEWTDQLWLVTRAPDDKPLDKDCRKLYDELVDADNTSCPTDRSPVRNNVARLVAASWLVANPFAVRDPYLESIIDSACRGLESLSRRGDVAALGVAAETLKPSARTG